MWLLLVAAFGFVVPNGFFIYWLFNEFHGVAPVLRHNLALRFMLDLTVTPVILTVYFAKHPLGPVRWPWFVLLSFMGGLGFSLPLYYWLNRRRIAELCLSLARPRQSGIGNQQSEISNSVTAVGGARSDGNRFRRLPTGS